MNSILFLGFILGITSNFHCIGMCGPIALAVPVDRSSNRKILFGILQYNFGRILTYSLLGIIVGSIGITINTLGFLQWLSIISGIYLILFAWRKLISERFSGHLPSLGIQSLIGRTLGKVIRSNSPFKLSFLGTLNGFLPCGMVYAGLLNALSAGNPVGSGLAMIAFGIGTLPAMVAIGFAANRISTETRKKFSKVVPYLLTIVGAMIILRGMNLDIPYISPKVTITKSKSVDKKQENETQAEKPQVEMSCCHKVEKCEK